MPAAHRHGDPRTCGAVTVAGGQSTVFSDGVLWAVAGDTNSHGGGALNASQSTARCEGRAVIVSGDSAAPDNLCPWPGPGGAHCAPAAAGGSGKTFAGG
jgi:uncharacterized Zn-binding protein involved in type VI secretion